MNTLSWFLYLADVLPRLAVGAGFVFTMLTLCFFIWIPISAIGAANGGGPTFPKTRWVVGCLLLALSTTLIPTRETLYLIAGSEAGEMVIKDENTQAIIKDVREVIQLQLERLKAPTASN